MTKVNPYALTAYVQNLASQLGLRDWEIDVGDRPCLGSDAAASIDICYGRRRATIFLSEGWDDNTPERRRHFLIHEVLHCHLDPVLEATKNLLGVVNRETFEVFRCFHHDAVERALDAIAVAVAPNYPLPPEPERTA